ncbi:hypothetical protein, partial [Microseira wollei]|uniref:hypothetical protein n=1 Tax=Microseira wollei TaxID=467598 RepID=UPI001CFE325F
KGAFCVAAALMLPAHCCQGVPHAAAIRYSSSGCKPLYTQMLRALDLVEIVRKGTVNSATNSFGHLLL